MLKINWRKKEDQCNLSQTSVALHESNQDFGSKFICRLEKSLEASYGKNPRRKEDVFCMEGFSTKVDSNISTKLPAQVRNTREAKFERESRRQSQVLTEVLNGGKPDLVWKYSPTAKNPSSYSHIWRLKEKGWATKRTHSIQWEEKYTAVSF